MISTRLTGRIAALVICSLAQIAGRATEWPQFRGPAASGVDASKALPIEWNVETGKNVRWQTPIPGLGHSCPIVWSNRIYLTTAVAVGDPELKVGLYGDIEPVEENAAQQWRLLALDRGTGKVLWNVLGHSAVPRVKRHPKATHCNSTPATDGNFIVTIFGSEGLFAFSMDGKLRWKKSLGPMDAGYFAVPSAQWGFGSSPIIHDGRVIVLCDVQTNSFLAAFDLKSGRELWRTARRDVPTWGSPAIVETASRKQIVVNGWHHTGGYKFADGKEIWRLDGGGDIPVPTPIFAEGLIYLTSAHGKVRPMRAIRPDATGDITPPTPDATNAGIAWVHPRLGNYMQTPIAVQGRIYSCFDAGIISCFDAKTGKVHFTERIGDGKQGFTASPVSDGRHLYIAAETGRVVVMPVTEKFSTVATNELGAICMATPAIADGTIFFRTQKKLITIGGK